MVELGNRTGLKRDASDGGSRREQTSVGRIALNGNPDADSGQVSPPHFWRRARAIIPLETTNLKTLSVSWAFLN